MSNMLAYVKRHKIRSAIIAIVIMAGGWFWYQKTRTAAVAVQYVTAAAQTDTVIASVTGTGQIQAQNQIDVKPQTDGRLTQVFVQYNQQVKQGQVLAIIDQQSAANSVAQAKANLDQAKASYDKLIAGAPDNTIQTQKLAIASAQLALDQAKKNYRDSATQQQQAVAKAQNTLSNDGLAANPSNVNSTATVAVSGSYSGTAPQGAYTIILSQSGDGLHYSSSGLGIGGDLIKRGLTQSIGSGLYINFSTTGTIDPSTTWTVSVPNTQGNNYQSDLNAYNTALQNQQQAQDQAQNAIDSAQNALDKANLAYQSTIAPPTNSDVASAKAQITSAQAQLQNAQTAYAATILTAPFDGVVAALNFSAGDKMTAGSTFATIITNQQIAKITLNEVDVAKIKLGQKATLTFDAIDGLQLTGQVAQIDTLGAVSQGVVTYGVKIAMDAGDPRVKPGMSVSSSVITAVAADVLTVPGSAVKTAPGGGNYVQILGSDGKPQNKTVTIGIADDTNTQILSGLNPGDQVVTQTVTTGSTSAAGGAAATGGLRIPGLGGGFGGGRAGGGGRGN